MRLDPASVQFWQIVTSPQGLNPSLTTSLLSCPPWTSFPSWRCFTVPGRHWPETFKFLRGQQCTFRVWCMIFWDLVHIRCRVPLPDKKCNIMAIMNAHWSTFISCFNFNVFGLRNYCREMVANVHHLLANVLGKIRLSPLPEILRIDRFDSSWLSVASHGNIARSDCDRILMDRDDIPLRLLLIYACCIVCRHERW